MAAYICNALCIYEIIDFRGITPPLTTHIKDEVISLFPNLLGIQDKNFHEELVEVKPGLLHHRMELLSEPPVNFKMIPTFQTKRAREEKMESSFISLGRAEHTVVVVSL
jgi:hypothetical protein